MSTNRSIFKFYIVVSGLLFQSCAPSLPSLKNEKIEPLVIPSQFPPSEFSGQVQNAKGVPSSANKRWEEIFQDTNLDALIKEALKNNQELNIIDQEINIANNEIMARQGEYFPKMDFKAGYEREKVGEYTSQGVSDATSEYEPGKNVPKVLDKYQVGLFTSWEIDIWAKLRNATKSSYFKYLSSIEGRKLLVTHLVAEIANTYYELLAYDKQLEIVNKYINLVSKAKELVELQQSSGRVTSLAVKRFEAEVYKNKSRQFELQQQITITENKINVLIGRFPQRIVRSSSQFDELVSKNILTGIPSALLDNRPDVKKAALELKAAQLDVKVAKARFYPSLSIEANAGYESFNSKHLFQSPTSVFYNLAANITAPLLNRQAIKADYFSANNKQIQALYNYEQTIIKAYAEVVNQMALINNLGKIYNLKSHQVGSLIASVEISGILFKAARVDYIEALLTQRDSLEAQVELVEVKKNQLISYVNLYKALGGGWREETKLPH